ncbi:6,7-dimethyl-8-ribityllumazine synthase [Methyloversatilis thermotolerans]|uniref:6,7-dimethyl-8-ribityllumazine synthase n=1 Tax=Methyloversatilis thermotolerans TaxID=1346290 RepID=UPI000476689C|nr:6,7-dimethyl-8-ribityllumazine synthase [Methyloversatilis thermotolerans]
MPRFNDIPEIAENLDGKNLRIAIAMARFNPDIGNGLLSACCDALRTLGVAPADTLIVSVPGALELPLVLQRLALSGKYDALVALGAVIRGETYHFEIVSNEMARGISDVQLKTGVPIANGVLTTENDDQALARMHEKGADCGRAAVEMARLIATLTE